ncbi:cyclin-dependent kinase 2-interacting protein-like [Chelonus insularis]|uniref:cyclin-dependent kinase 2-interacting protein-like n=1 Tax=Chelonus insularis TaxID=460826 RepID=UPI00158C6CD0|nr:cyclin-dependent kinase 2-interacting protein-like [Chelonus insularis]
MDQYRPVITSPKVSPQTNLTGHKRLVKDLAADIHAEIQKWNEIFLHGLDIIKSIMAIKVDDSYPEGLQNLCDQLEMDVDKMDGIVEKFKRASRRIHLISSLYSDEKLFITWPIDKFVDTFEEIYEVYKDEVEVKRLVMENIAHDYSESWQQVHLALWVTQPKIPSNINLTLEALLTETGHR